MKAPVNANCFFSTLVNGFRVNIGVEGYKYHAKIFIGYFHHRGVMEPAQVEVPAEKCAGETGKEHGRKGSAYHRETELPGVWHDHTSPHRQCYKDQIGEKGNYLKILMCTIVICLKNTLIWASIFRHTWIFFSSSTKVQVPENFALLIKFHIISILSMKIPIEKMVKKFCVSIRNIASNRLVDKLIKHLEFSTEHNID